MRKKLADEAAKEQKRLDTMKALMKAILTDLQAFDKHGAKSPQELAKQQADLTEKSGKFREQWLGGKKVEVADLLGLRSASAPRDDRLGGRRLAGGGEQALRRPGDLRQVPRRTSSRASAPCG